MTTLVLLREALRTARRWHHYALRLSFLLVLSVTVVLAWKQTLVPGSPPGAAGTLGRALFDLYVVVQLAGVSIMAPLLVAQGLQEERDDHTLELLAITKVRNHHVMIGKVLSRLLVVLTVVYGGLPVLALVVGLGGVSAWEVANALGITLGLTLATGAIGGAIALLTRGVLLPALTAAAWAAVYSSVVPLLQQAFLPMTGLRGGLPIAVAEGIARTDATGLVVAATFLPPMVLAWTVGSSVFDRVTRSAPPGVGGDVAVLTGLLALFTLAGPALAPFLGDLGVAVVWVWAVGVGAFGTLLSLLGLIFVARLRPGRIESKSRSVLGNPFAWLGLARIEKGAVLFWTSGLVLFGYLACIPIVDFVSTAAAVTCASVAMGLSVVMATASVAQERISGTLTLVLTTTSSESRIVRGKLFAVAAASLPWAALALVLWLEAAHLGRHELLTLMGPDYQPRSPLGPSLWPFAGPRVFAAGLWVFVTWLLATSLSMLVALVVRPARLAWVLTLGLGALWLAVPAMPLPPLFEPARLLLFPIGGAAWMYGPGVPPELALSTVATGMLALTSVLLLSTRLRRWAR